MNIKLAPNTPSQIRQTLNPCTEDKSAGLSKDEILKILKAKKLKDKNGNDITPVLEDMKDRQECVLICNMSGDEKNAPISRYLTANHSDRLSAGIKIIAKAGNCREVLIYAPKDMDTSSMCKKFSGDLTVTEIKGQESLVLRDVSALYNEIENGEIRVNKVELEFEKEFLSQGWQGRPTAVMDAETLCIAANIAENTESKLTKLVVVNAVDSIIAEVPAGTAIKKLLTELEKTFARPVLTGGVLGRFIDINADENAAIGYEWASDSITVFSENECLTKKTAELLEDARNQSCQKCVMCREGSFQLSTMYSAIAAGKGRREDIALIEDISPLIIQGTICGFGENMAGLAYSSIILNKDETEAHILKKTCPAGECESFKSFYIDPLLCTGCGDCFDACEYDAIEGKTKFIHIIDQKMCEKCGECMNVCPEDAVVTQKIRVPKNLMRAGTFK